MIELPLRMEGFLGGEFTEVLSMNCNFEFLIPVVSFVVCIVSVFNVLDC